MVPQMQLQFVTNCVFIATLAGFCHQKHSISVSFYRDMYYNILNEMYITS